LEEREAEKKKTRRRGKYRALEFTKLLMLRLYSSIKVAPQLVNLKEKV